MILNFVFSFFCFDTSEKNGNMFHLTSSQRKLMKIVPNVERGNKFVPKHVFHGSVGNNITENLQDFYP